MSYTHPDLVPNAPLREAFLRSEMTASDVCRAIGWVRTCQRRGRRTLQTSGQTSRLKRALGLASSWHNRPYGRRRYESTQSHLSYGTAVSIALALGVDPVEVGL